jgi:hypothetical protein
MKGALSRKKRGAPSRAADKHELSLGDELTLDPDEKSRAGSKRPSKMRKRQEAGDFVEEGMTQKILQEARKQQEEMDHERYGPRVLNPCVHIHQISFLVPDFVVIRCSLCVPTFTPMVSACILYFVPPLPSLPRVQIGQ